MTPFSATILAIKSDSLEGVTLAMRELETEIAIEQRYILANGDRNDASPTPEWEAYKAKAEENLHEWDRLKVLRDDLKAETQAA
jgi:hypothetical protein